MRRQQMLACVMGGPLLVRLMKHLNVLLLCKPLL